MSKELTASFCYTSINNINERESKELTAIYQWLTRKNIKCGVWCHKAIIVGPVYGIKIFPTFQFLQFLNNVIERNFDEHNCRFKKFQSIIGFSCLKSKELGVYIHLFVLVFAHYLFKVFLASLYKYFTFLSTVILMSLIFYARRWFSYNQDKNTYLYFRNINLISLFWVLMSDERFSDHFIF